MSRTWLAEMVRRAFLQAGTDCMGARAPGRLTRRQFLQAPAVAGVGPLLPVGRRAMAHIYDGAAPRIAVVGAGLAGLTCAYRLRRAGYAATLYEADGRVGGRCWTDRTTFGQGQMAEHGGELIDSGHTATKHLAQELGLDLENLRRAEPNQAEPLFWFDGAPYTYEEATREIKTVWQRLHADVVAAGYPTLYNAYTRRGWELDHLSIPEWIGEAIPGGMGSRLGRLLAVAYTCYYGGDAADQSALNLLYMLGFRGQGRFRLYGPSDEKYHVRGGNDQIAGRMAEALSGQIEPFAALTALRQHGDGSYTLTLQRDSAAWDEPYDLVVLALPFAVLREQVDFSGAGFRPLKAEAIRETGMGTNTKLQLQFSERHWESLGCQGETYADTGYQSSWDSSLGQEGTAGLLVNFTGGLTGLAQTGDPPNLATTFLEQIEPVLPGLTARWNGRVLLDYWPGHPWTLGSYSYFRVGQWTRFAGIAGEPEGNCYFAGEHTSLDYQGFLNGGVETGERAAGEILATVHGRRRR